MKEIPGEWKIQAIVTGSRFLYTVTTAEGVSGVQDDRALPWTLESNQLRIMIVPDDGARLRIRVEDLTKEDIKAQAQVPVRIYKITGAYMKMRSFLLPRPGKTWRRS